MTVRHSSTWSRRSRHTGQRLTEATRLPSIPCYPTGTAEQAINWLNVVDEFKIRNRRNIFPRWSILMVVLAVMAI